MLFSNFKNQNLSNFSDGLELQEDVKLFTTYFCVRVTRKDLETAVRVIVADL